MSPEQALDRAQWLAAGGDVEAAAAVADEVLRAEPDHLALLLLRASLHLQARESERALALNERAIAIAPGSSEAWNALARYRHALGQDQEALLAAKEAHRLLGEGDNGRYAAPVYLTLVWCLRVLRRHREALDVAEQGLARIPDSILAQWAATVEEELAEASKEGC